MRLSLFATLALAVLAGPASAQDIPRAAGTVAQTACPCSSYGPYPCGVVTVVALPDQAGALGLTDAQLDDVRAIRQQTLRVAHDIIGDIDALRDALHTLDRPFALDETFALLYDLGQHEAELAAAFETGEAVLLGALTEEQRARWNGLVAEAAALQETAPGCRSAP